MRSRLSGRVAETVSRDTLAIPYPLSIGVLAGKHEDLPSLLTVCHFVVSSSSLPGSHQARDSGSGPKRCVCVSVCVFACVLVSVGGGSERGVGLYVVGFGCLIADGVLLSEVVVLRALRQATEFLHSSRSHSLHSLRSRLPNPFPPSHLRTSAVDTVVHCIVNIESLPPSRSASRDVGLSDGPEQAQQDQTLFRELHIARDPDLDRPRPSPGKRKHVGPLPPPVFPDNGDKGAEEAALLKAYQVDLTHCDFDNDILC